MPRLRPILLPVLAACLIGAVVTVGVAVGCAMSKQTTQSSASSPSGWNNPRTGSSYAVSTGERARGSRWVFMMILPEKNMIFEPGAELEKGLPLPVEAFPPESHSGERFVRIVGWPVECAWGAVDSHFRSSLPTPLPLTAVHALSVGRPLNFTDARGICGYLPIAPIWSGLALNTIFYGMMAWGLLFLPGTLRRWRRRRGGRCVKCGYNREGLAMGAACPECGAGLGRLGTV